MAFHRAQPQELFFSAPGHFSTRWIVGVPIPKKFGVVGHRLALTEAATPAFTGWTDNVASTS
jgi:hypothetical protein